MQICSVAPIAFSSRSERAALILELNSLKVVSFKQFVLSAVEARKKSPTCVSFEQTAAVYFSDLPHKTCHSYQTIIALYLRVRM